MANRALFVLMACLVAVPAAAQRKDALQSAPAAAASDDPVVARVNGTPLHRSQLQVLQAMLPPEIQKQPMEQLYPRLVNELVNMTLVAQAARKAKLADDPLVKIRTEFATDQVLQQAYFGGMIKKEVTEQKLHARYDQYVKSSPAQEEVEARHILVPSEEEAKAVIAELNKGADFATLAKDKTTDPAGKASGGDLGWFSRQDMVKDFADAAFKLKKGEYTKTPVKTQFGWHVIKLEDRREGTAPSYEQIAPKLAQEMAQELGNARLKELASASKIEVFRPDGSPIPPQPPAGAPAPGAPALAPPLAGVAPGGPPALGVPRLAPATQDLGQGK
ncbi:MAG TPA: peptidylprolyl isomerase [Stellaceae bacterium]|nr:peptidylprolyl isomerase [Stellaceae bacterium]